MTGRAAGYCAGFAVPGYMDPGWYGGFRGRGGRGRRYWPYAAGFPGWFPAAAGYRPWGPTPAPLPGFPPYSSAPGYWPSKDEELQMLKEQAESFRNTLESVEKRITELESEQADAEA